MVDVQACFRLLLKRSPLPDELPYWRNLVETHQIPLQALVDEFLSSAEFREKQAAASRPELVDLADFQLAVRPNDYFIGAAIARDRQYEPAVTAALRSLLKPGDLFLDVGANIGYFTMLGAILVGPAGRVLAVEPNRDNCDLMAQSIAANGFTNVTLYPYAAAEKAQRFQLDTAGAGSNGRIIDDSPQAVPGSSPPNPVEAVALDELLAGLERLDVVKLDVEGAEPRALQGMQQLLERFRPEILLEFSPALIEMTSHVRPEALLHLLVTAGYELHLVGEEKGGVALTVAEMLARQETAGGSHLDLLAVPGSPPFP